MKQKHKGKWKDIKVNRKERDRIYQRVRSKAKEILRKRHKKEHSKIIKFLLEREFKRKLKKVN